MEESSKLTEDPKVDDNESRHKKWMSMDDFGVDSDAYDASKESGDGERNNSESKGSLPESIPESISEDSPSKQQQSSTGSSNVSAKDAAAVTDALSSNPSGNSAAEAKKSPKKQSKGPHIPAASTKSSDSGDKRGGRIRLGICAMDKKARSKPSAEILSRLDENLFQVVFFGDDALLNLPIEEWPVVDVLIAFFSKGYPLPKAKAYVELRKPFILNDLNLQEVLQDRRKVYDLLEGSGIDVPRHVYLSRDGYVSTGTGDGNGHKEFELQEFDDHIEVNGIAIHKPFVEKPVDAEDHNISIYYPSSAGGGCKKLFRKVGNRSSEFYPDINEVRRDGSYIYEEFVETQGTDVKMYTVGPEYGHAEARKSPTVDGKVERNSDGKEVRFPVILTFREKEIARRIVLVFKQFVCGFDILRVQEGHNVVSYVCDVNGWSFVKNSRKYYDDCAQILSEHILALTKPAAFKTFSTLDPLIKMSHNLLDEEIVEEPRKRETFLSRATRMLQGEPADDDEEDEADARSTGTLHVPEPTGSPSRADTAELLSTAAATLVEGALPVREFPNNLTSEPASMAQSSNSSESEDYLPMRRIRSSSLHGSHQEELRCVVAIFRHGDRTPKQKLKINMREPHILEFFHKHVKKCSDDLKVKAKAPMTEFLETVKTTLGQLGPDSDKDLKHQLLHMRDILERWKIAGLNRKLQIKPRKFEDYEDEDGDVEVKCIEVQLILKWGGNLTKLGEKQSVNLGQTLRHDMYPDAPGGGILRLHSTFRHDLKIKTSDEGRVMKTAAAFAKGLLELEGDIPPILVSLVHKEKGSMHMLDPSGNREAKLELDDCKEKITANLQRDVDIATAEETDLEQLIGPKELSSLRQALEEIKNPRKTLFEIHETMGELIKQLEAMLDNPRSAHEKRIEGGEGLEGDTEDDVALSGVKLYKGETLLEMTERWRFIYDRLYDPKADKFDLSRIPDVHDNARFDVLHNPHVGLTTTLESLYHLAKIMADCVVPQEYGTTVEEKRSVGVKICRGLLEKIKFDLGVARTDNEVDMRYMINMDYSADLPISTMGRRIRTRLYFTSESHLHTVLNVFRFAETAKDQKSILSEHGVSVVNATPELCYLTHVVLRVFEDSRRDMKDPRRFRVEIHFSPGATATPLHMHEGERDSDATRFATSPLQMIGREGLTCEEVESFFDAAIQAGRTDEDEEPYDVGSTSTAAENSQAKKKEKKDKDKKKDKKERKDKDKKKATTIPPPPAATPPPAPVPEVQSVPREEIAVDLPQDLPPAIEELIVDPLPPPTINVPTARGVAGEDDKESERNKRIWTRKYFWSTIAVTSFALGVSCLCLALTVQERDTRRHKRRWTRR